MTVTANNIAAAGVATATDGLVQKVCMLNNLKLSQVTFGLWRLADVPKHDQTPQSILARIKHCVNLGITSFDAADIYGGGDGHVCEKLFGAALALAEPELRDQIQIISKTGIVCLEAHGMKTTKHYNLTADYILGHVEDSLKALHTDYLDLLLIHRPSPLMNADEVSSAFIKLFDSGKVRHFGVSNFTVSQFDLLQSRLPFPLVTNQIEMHPLRMEPMHDGTLDHHQRHRVSPMIWSPLAGGLLVNTNTADSRVIRVQKKMAEVAKEIGGGFTLDQICYAWLLTHPSKPIVVIGTNSPERIVAAARAASIKLSLEQWFSIWEASAGREVP